MANELYCDNFIMSEDGENFEMTQTTKGDPGEGVPTGGTAGQVLKKVSDDDYDTEWADNNAGDIGYDPAETYQSGSAGAALNDLTRQLSDLEDTVSTTQIIDTASGAIASFDDGADEQPVKKLVAQIEPVQDLHGQDSPYPAGGWKNLLNTVLIAGTPSDTEFSNDTKRTFTVGTYIDGLTNNNYFKKRATAVSVAENRVAFTTDARAYGISIPLVGLTPGSQYTVSASITNGRIGLSFYAEDGTWISGSTAVATAYYTATVPTNAYYTLVIFNGSEEDVESIFTNIQLELGSSATSFAPYENICPISGWTGAEIEQSGVNVWDEEWELGVFNNSTGEKVPNSSNIRSTNYIRIKPGKSYAFIKPESSRVFYYGIDKSFISTVVVPTNTYAITAPDIAYYLRFQVGGTTYNHDISINYPATDTSYHHYTGNQISVTFPDEAGTVYGGHITINPDRTGELVVDRASFNWTSGGNLTSRGAWSISKDDVVTINSDNQTTLKGAVCDKLPSGTWAQINNQNTNVSIAGCVFGNGLALRIVGFTTAEEYTAFLADNPLQFVYLLKEPITYQLTESEISGILETLYGTNNIWLSSGDTEVTYPADTKLYIDGKIAEAIAALNS